MKELLLLAILFSSFNAFADKWDDIVNSMTSKSKTVVKRNKYSDQAKENIANGYIFGKTGVKRAQVQNRQVLIPKTRAGDKGQYYLLKVWRVDGLVVAVHKRVSSISGTGYTQTETDCANWKMRVIGYSESSPDSISSNPTKWFNLISGSSKSDLANFVCMKY